MQRKKWTAKAEVTDSLLKFREKRKWQIALRRYVLEQKGSSAYAPFFGIDMANFRKWIEIQFDEEANWENFSKNWQFDHIIPVAYFDFEKDSDLKLCWNFTNIRVEKLTSNKNRGNRIDVLAAKAYFEALFQGTQYPICQKMVDKIDELEVSQIESNKKLEEFINGNKDYLLGILAFEEYEYQKLNEGTSLESVLAEKKLVAKFGGE